MHIFYTPDIIGNDYVLSETESHHCIKVLRLSEGEKVNLVDGKGGFYVAEITFAHPKRCQLSVKEVVEEYEKRPYHLHIAIAPTKSNERFEWFLEKCTEIGIDEITPLRTKNSERTTLKAERMEKIITSAVKQSIKAYHPKLYELCKFETFLTEYQSYTGLKMIATCENIEKKSLKKIYTSQSNALILIGPEGDFSPEEVQLAVENNFVPISLGNSRLRTETAGIIACHTVMLLNETV